MWLMRAYAMDWPRCSRRWLAMWISRARMVIGDHGQIVRRAGRRFHSGIGAKQKRAARHVDENLAKGPHAFDGARHEYFSSGMALASARPSSAAVMNGSRMSCRLGRFSPARAGSARAPRQANSAYLPMLLFIRCYLSPDNTGLRSPGFAARSAASKPPFNLISSVVMSARRLPPWRIHIRRGNRTPDTVIHPSI